MSPLFLPSLKGIITSFLLRRVVFNLKQSWVSVLKIFTKSQGQVHIPVVSERMLYNKNIGTETACARLKGATTI